MRIDGTRVRLAASDAANFLACRYLTRLDLLRAQRAVSPPRSFDVAFEALVERGEEHEARVLERFQSEGREVVSLDPGLDPASAAALTREALRGVADVIYQGVLLADDAQSGESLALFGRPDFLVRAGVLPPSGQPSEEASGGYEVVDAKLARSAKARAVLQTAFYSHLLAQVQAVPPRWMHLALGNGEFVPFKVNDFAAYERQIRRLLTLFLEADGSEPADLYPEPVEHCAICRWSPACAQRRRDDDDLSLVAGMTRRQRRVLKGAGIATRRGLAGLVPLPGVESLGRESLQRAQLQAQLQVASEDVGSIRYRLLGPERNDAGELVANRGLLALPAPTEGDVFFDIEGARYYSEDGREFGLQYLFGLVDTADLDTDGQPRYRAFWALNRAEEKAAFEQLIDFLTERRRQHPGLHVYHYNHYEPTSLDHLTELHGTRQQALGRLMGRFATREDELDDLFRLGVFVDLYRVVRQSLRAGVESYSIKRLEPLCGYSRQVDLADATRQLIIFESGLEAGTAAADPARSVVAGYNQDDCRATLALRDWLEERRTELSADLGRELPRPKFDEEEARAPEDPEVTRIRAALLAGIPADQASRSEEQRAKALMADLLDWHRREAKPAWWRFFYVRTLSPTELVGEPDALGDLRGGEQVGTIRKSVIRRFTFPPQEHPFDEGDKGYDPVRGSVWTIHSLDEEHGVIDLTVGRDRADDPAPAALVEDGPPKQRVLAERLLNLGDRIVREGVAGTDAATGLLLRRRPQVDDVQSGPLLTGRTAVAAAAVPLAVALRDSYLPIQGPPGTGKTYLAAEQVLALVAEGRRVGLTGLSHAVIYNFIGEIVTHATERGVAVRIGQRAEKGNPFLHPSATRLEYPELEQGLRGGDLDIGAGTAFTWARPEFQGIVDALFVDEAGQMSLANTMAIAGAGRNLILLGDPQQLAQPSQAAHPPGAGVSALEHILGERDTVPAEAGLLLDRTWRMHPALCAYTSEMFYDDKLISQPGRDQQAVAGPASLPSAGLSHRSVWHEGNRNSSPEEAKQIAAVAGELLAGRWTDTEGKTRPLSQQDILVVTPYNAQVRAIEEALAATGWDEIRVGTVDKFQGREAPIVLYSMATSNADEAPRGMEFLYDLHRLNVATSRAKGLAIMVASPDLLRVFCGTPRQMVLANALCRSWEWGPRLPACQPDG